MKNKNILMDYLQLSSAEYDEMIFQTYWNWCAKHGLTQFHIQQLLANAAVNSWWLNEFSKFEKEFITAYDSLPKRKTLLHHTYTAMTAQIFNLYPKPLMAAIKMDNLMKELEFKKDRPNYSSN